jgi:hypothetical protein
MLGWLIKIYTSNDFYTEINKAFAEKQFESIKYYNAFLLDYVQHVGKDYAYKELLKPVYRGVPSIFVNMDDYRLGSIGYWPCLTSTSKLISTALNFSKIKSSSDEPLLVFEIYLSPQNKGALPTCIELPEDYSWIKFREKEVLLLNFFNF